MDAAKDEYDDNAVVNEALRGTARRGRSSRIG